MALIDTQFFKTPKYFYKISFTPLNTLYTFFSMQNHCLDNFLNANVLKLHHLFSKTNALYWILENQTLAKIKVHGIMDFMLYSRFIQWILCYRRQRRPGSRTIVSDDIKATVIDPAVNPCLLVRECSQTYWLFIKPAGKKDILWGYLAGHHVPVKCHKQHLQNSSSVFALV